MSTNNKEVYIVTSGCYSDYGINAVFLSKENAEAFRDEYIKAGTIDVEIETWNADERAGEVSRRMWEIQLFVEGGGLRSDGSYTRLFPANDRTVEDPTYDDGKFGFVSAISLVSRDHAIKLAAEKRQALLRTRTEKA